MILVAVGGALGAVARYLLGSAVQRVMPPFFPYGTFVVNVVGCLVFGLIAGLGESRFVITPSGRAFLFIGVLGGFTTFSSFTFETFELVRNGQMMQAAANVTGQVSLGFLALWLGIGAGRSV